MDATTHNPAIVERKKVVYGIELGSKKKSEKLRLIIEALVNEHYKLIPVPEERLPLMVSALECPTGWARARMYVDGAANWESNIYDRHGVLVVSIFGWMSIGRALLSDKFTATRDSELGWLDFHGNKAKECEHVATILTLDWDG